MIRTFAQDDVEELARRATVPVIDPSTDSAHPCQALADMMTIRERLGRLRVFASPTSATNNVCTSPSWRRELGMEFVAATPEGYEPDPRVVEIAREAGGAVELSDDPREAAQGADVLYTDVWTSMGQEEEKERRLRDLAGFGIDDELVGLAGDEAIVLHCLPAHYGEEITEDVLYGRQSAVWDEAEDGLRTRRARCWRSSSLSVGA